MPIKARIDMLSTGIRTPVGIKVLGTDLVRDRQARASNRGCGPYGAGHRRASSPNGTIGGYYLNVDPDRAQLARYGLTIGDVQDVIAMALGAEPVTTTVEGRERYAVSIRYPRDYRSDPEAIANQVLIPLTGRRHSPSRRGGQGKSGAGPVQHSHRECATRDIHLCRCARPRYWRLCCRRAEGGGQRACSSRPGSYATWSGQFEYLERAKARLKIVVPVTLLIIFLLLFLNFRRITETLIVMLSVPFALVGGLWLMWWLGFNLSVAVAVGFIALAGVAAQTGVVMLIYLDNALDRAEAATDARV